MDCRKVVIYINDTHSDDAVIKEIEDQTEEEESEEPMDIDKRLEEVGIDRPDIDEAQQEITPVSEILNEHAQED